MSLCFLLGWRFVLKQQRNAWIFDPLDLLSSSLPSPAFLDHIPISFFFPSDIDNVGHIFVNALTH